MAKLNVIEEPPPLITTWMCSACKTEHGTLLNDAQLTTLTVGDTTTRRLHLGTADLRCPNDSIKETPMMKYKPGAKVRIDYPDGTSLVGFVAGEPSTAVWFSCSEKAVTIRAEDIITILEQPRIKQPDQFGAAVTAGSHLTVDREDWLRTHERGQCGSKDPYACHHWRNVNGQMVVWNSLVDPELIRAGL